MFTIEELSDVANKFLRDTYQLELEIPIVINNRLRIAMAKYVTQWKTDIPKRIELAGSLLKYGHEDVIVDTLKHELVHYALNVLNLPCDDGDDYFENELKRLNIGATEICYVGELYKCKCSKCDSNLLTHVKSEFKSGKYVTTCCKGKVEYLETLIFNGTEGMVYV